MYWKFQLLFTIFTNNCQKTTNIFKNYTLVFIKMNNEDLQHWFDDMSQ